MDVLLAPSVIIDSKGEVTVLLYRDSYKTLAELSEKEMRLAGLRINPKTNIGSRTRYYKNIKVKLIDEKNVRFLFSFILGINYGKKGCFS